MTKAGHVCKFKKPPKEAKPVLKWVRHMSTQSDGAITGHRLPLALVARRTKKKSDSTPKSADFFFSDFFFVKHRFLYLEVTPRKHYVFLVIP